MESKQPVVSSVFDSIRDNTLLSIAIVLALFAAAFYAAFALVPYIVIFVVTNFFFIYVAVVYLLKFWESEKEETTKRVPSVSVIVSAYNKEDTIEKCLNSVLAMDYPKPVQVIVVEDASTDRTWDKVRKFAGRVEIIRHRTNQGKGRSINMALKRAEGEVVACIDADTYPERGALRKMVRHFTDGVGAVIALVCVHEPRNLIQKIQEIEYYAAFGFWHTALSKMDGLLVTPGPMSLYTKKALEDVGGFDEDNITEDMEIALHLQEAGYRIKCTTDAKIYTEVPDTLPKLYRQRLRWLRGKIFNGFKYSHMLFNTKYGDFGRFVYPVSSLVELLGVVVVLRVLALHAGNFLNTLFSSIGVAAVDVGLLANVGLYTQAMLNSSMFFFVFTLVVWGYIVWISFGLARQKINPLHVVPVAIFMTVYSIFISLVYFSSMVHEAVGTKRRW